MKNLILLGLFSISSFCIAQSPQKFTYQSVIRDASDNLVLYSSIGIRISIRQASASGTIVFQEEHTPTTNSNGLASLEIGSGTVVTGSFSTIDWGSGPYFLETEVDPLGGSSYTINGTSQLLSVPYSLYANKADSVANDQVNDADADPTNELQAVSFSNDTLYLSDGGQVYLGAYGIDLVDDADNDPNNEIELPATANPGDLLEFDGTSWVAAAPAGSNGPGAVMYIYDGQTCPSGWTTQQINVAIFGGVAVDACWTDTPCVVMYIYDGQTCPTGWTLQPIGAAVVNGSTLPVDACFKCY